MKILVGLLALMLPVAVLASALSAVGFVVLAFYALPPAWSATFSVFSALVAVSGYKVMSAANADPALQEFLNALASQTLSLTLVIGGMGYFAWYAASQVSPWWALLSPIIMVCYLAAQLLLMGGLELLNPDGGREAAAQRAASANSSGER
jgi:hypothetical protein